MVRITPIDDPSSYWIAEITSEFNDEERILIGANGRLTLDSYGQQVDLWDGWPEEPDPTYLLRNGEESDETDDEG